MSEVESLSAGEPEQIKISLDALQKFFVDAINSIDAEQYREQAKALALSLFDKYVQPYDIPRLPEFIETRLEGVVREAIPMWVDGCSTRSRTRAAKTRRRRKSAMRLISSKPTRRKRDRRSSLHLRSFAG